MIRFLRLCLLLGVGANCWAQTPGGVSTSLRVWLKANTGTTGTANVTQWNDNSGNGLNATATSGPELLTDRINFNPSLQFDGSETMQVTNGIFGSITKNDMFVYFINRSDIVQNSTIFFEVLASGKRFGSHLPWGDSNVYFDLGTCCGSSRINTNWSSNTAEYYLWSYGSSTSTGTSTGTRKYIKREGLTLVSNNNNDNGTGANNNFYLASSNGSSSFHTGEIAEIIVFDAIPTAAEEQQIQSYLALKYGITLDQGTAQDYVASDGTTIFDATTVFASYNEDITGIGRDDNSALDQQQSMSINSDAVISMDKGGLFSSDLDFLVWGNDGSSLLLTTNGSHPSYTYRSQRTWRVDLTGTPGTVDVSFELGGGFPNSGDPSDYALLKDAVDADFSSGATAYTTGASIVGNTLTFTGVTWSDGEYFTLGSEVRPKYPGGVAGSLVLWLKANQGVTGTTTVTLWEDQSGNANDVSDASGPELINPRVNFNPALQFDQSASEHLEDNDGLWGTSSVSSINVYLLARTNTILARSIFREPLNGANGRFGSHLPWSDNQLYFDAGTCCTTNYRINTNWGGSTGIEYIWTMNGSTVSTPEGNNHEIMRDGSSLISDNSYLGFTGNGSTFYLGSSVNTSYFDGEISEMIVYDQDLTQTEQRQIHSYLAIKYGITLGHDLLSSAATTLWDNTANSTFHNDVAAIGRDDDSDLEQKQSKSENSDAVVTVALGSVASDNASNSNSFSADQSFLVWGNDDGALSAGGVTDLPGGIEARIAREWLVEENGTVGTVRIQMDLSDIEGTSGPGTNDLQFVRLLVDDDGDFSSGVTVVSSVSFDNATDVIDFDHDFTVGTGFYFSIGSVDGVSAPLPIELLSFEALPVNDVVLLKWSTASEINNDFFTIERSLDGVNFEEILTVDGAGNSESVIHYQIEDKEPWSGQTFYRLKQTDFDGSSRYSNIATVLLDVTFEIRVAPNPVLNGKLQLRVGVPKASAIEFRLYDAQGRPVFQDVRQLKGGYSGIEFPTNLATGIYLLRAQAGTSKLVKIIVD